MKFKIGDYVSFKMSNRDKIFGYITNIEDEICTIQQTRKEINSVSSIQFGLMLRELTKEDKKYF